jgi:hypothetical protein
MQARPILTFYNLNPTGEVVCQMFSKMAPTPPEKPLHQQSRSRSCFWRSRSPAGGFGSGSTSGSRWSPPKRSILQRLRVWSCPWSTSRLPKGRRSHDFVAPPDSAPVFPPLPSGGTRGCRNGRREETEGQRRKAREKKGEEKRAVATPRICLCSVDSRRRPSICAAGVGNRRGGGGGGGRGTCGRRRGAARGTDGWGAGAGADQGRRWPTQGGATRILRRSDRARRCGWNG